MEVNLQRLHSLFQDTIDRFNTMEHRIDRLIRVAAPLANKLKALKAIEQIDVAIPGNTVPAPAGRLQAKEEHGQCNLQ